MSAPIDFYFDFSSPYGYLASDKIEEVAAKAGREVRWRPVLLGAIMKETGGRPLIGVPLKTNYATRDWARMARFADIPWVLPDPIPIAAIAASRAFWWLDDRDPGQAKDLARALFLAYFGDGVNISGAHAVARVAESVGVVRDELLAALQDPEVKARLRAETDAAMAAGVCGSPFFIVDGEPFWGSDRMWMIQRWLATGGW